MEIPVSKEKAENKELGALLLDIGIALLKSGANCARIRTSMARVAGAYHRVPNISIGPKSISLTLNDKEGATVFSGIRSTAAHGIDFTVISRISRLCVMAEEEKTPLPEFKNKFFEAQVTESYSRWVVLCFVSLAGAAFCYTFGGGYIEMVITFGATFCGLFVKQQLSKDHFNPYVCTYVAAVVASVFIAIFHFFGSINAPVFAFSTCVLFLIPGVGLINCFTDLADGSTMNGMVKGVNALLYVLAIAMGLTTTIIIFNLNS